MTGQLVSVVARAWCKGASFAFVQGQLLVGCCYMDQHWLRPLRVAGYTEAVGHTKLSGRSQ